MKSLFGDSFNPTMAKKCFMNISDGVPTLTRTPYGTFDLINIHDSAIEFNNWPAD